MIDCLRMMSSIKHVLNEVIFFLDLDVFGTNTFTFKFPKNVEEKMQKNTKVETVLDRNICLVPWPDEVLGWKN